MKVLKIACLICCLGLFPMGLAAQEAQFLSRIRQITFEGKRAGEGYFNSDGSKLIFQSEREAGNPFYQIYVLDLKSGDSKRVSNGAGKTTCSFFRPGTDRVLYASTHLDPESAALQQKESEQRASGQERRYSWDYDPHFDIFESGEDGSKVVRLTDAEGYDAEGSYSPDGAKIAFCSMRSAYPAASLSAEDRKRAETDLSYFGEIYIMNSNGTDPKRLTHTPGYDGGPFFSPDGKRIIWRRFDEHGVIADIHTMALDGSDERQLTDFKSMSWAPYFHPSGDYVVFACNKLGFANFEVFMVDAQGTKEPVRVTSTEGFDGLPVFTPDGKQLCWTSQRHGGKGGQMYLAAWNDAEARKALAMAPARAKAASVAFEPAISEKDLRAEIEYLASDALEGRLTGTPGEQKAADYLVQRYKQIGLVPLADQKDFTSTFEYTSGVVTGPGNGLEAMKVEANPHKTLEDLIKEAKEPKAFELSKDFLPLAFSDNGTTEGLVAFAGYGLVVPGENGDKPEYDSYGELDVEGRIVVVLRYVPEGIDAEKRQRYNRYAGLRFKALQARDRGAAGMLVVSGPNSPTSNTLVALSIDLGGTASKMFAGSINIATAEALIKSSGKNLKDLQTELDPGEVKTAFNVDEAAVRLKVDLSKKMSTGHNIVGVLPPTSEINKDTEYVAVGAHYDHLGSGPSTSSLARSGEEAKIHYGADDNASGVAAMLEIAGHMASSKEPRKRGVIFAAWSGEEMGLLGSANFSRKPPIDIAKLSAYLNMDMVGRLTENKLAIQGVGSSSEWRKLLERKNIVAGFALTLTDDPYLPTDSTSFYEQKVPGLQFFSGAHEDYHRPTDTADKINYPDLARIAELVESITLDLANSESRPQYAVVERAATPPGGRDTMRAYLGTIPDYATEGIDGVKLSGVRAGGPAEKGGVKQGDIIVEFGGKKISNVYDYTYVLDAVKIGEPVKISVMREGKRVELTVVPEARK